VSDANFQNVRFPAVLNTVIELGSMEATKELVKLGIGVSILAPWIARKEIEDGSLVALPLGRPALARETAEPRGRNLYRVVRVRLHALPVRFFVRWPAEHLK
jgi:DNA-binding transcriptional LysR family regulator